MQLLLKRSFVLIISASFFCVSFGVAQMPDLDRTKPAMPDITLSRGSRGNDPLDKLSPSLRMLYGQFTSGRGRGRTDEGVGGFTDAQLSESFGIKPGESDPLVTLAVSFAAKNDTAGLGKGFATVARAGNTAYVMARISKVAALSNMKNVTAIGVMMAENTPPVPREEKPRSFSVGRGGQAPPPAAGATLGDQFNKAGLTGKGVIVGVIDTGIDWKHPDFIRPDGTSRILAIWDVFDQSYQTSNGSIGTKPPVFLEDTKSWLGTIYTNAQINAALKGAGTVNTADRFGHGTAVAGTAASNGRAAGNGVLAGTFPGVAPEADLIVVRASECGSFASVAELTAQWMIDTAQSLKRPIVINMSFGGHYGGHNGTLDNEKFIDSVTGPGMPGRAITISAGNEGQYSLHASGRFGPDRKGQADNFSSMTELFAKSPSVVSAFFDPKDNWGIAFRSNNAIFQGTDGKAAVIYLFKDGGTISYKTGHDLKDPDAFNEFVDTVTQGFHPGGAAASDQLDIQLPAGNYNFWAFGSGPNVKNGRFDLYSVSYSKASFGIGTDKTGMVGSPGNAKNAITVGSYDFRDRWENAAGETSFYNLLLGSPSYYTSPGPRRDGLTKPDISSPARYTISPLSSFAKTMNGGCEESMATEGEDLVTRDGYHIAWQGTSASSPFTAGVIALMLQKNPNLDAEQIRQIVKSTARHGSTVGSVPNPAWGWGMIDPAAAIAATPAPGAVTVKKPVR